MTVETQPKPNTLGHWAALGIQKYLNKVLSHEAEVLKDQDPEELHQMRVGMRRLRSAATGFAPVLDLPKAAGDRQIGKIARRLGELRDLDVLLEALNTHYYPPLPDKEKKALDVVLLQLVKRRQKAFKLVRSTLDSKSYREMKQQLQQWIDFPQYTAIEKLPVEEVLPDLLLPQVSKLFLHPGWLFGVEHLPEETEAVENGSDGDRPAPTLSKKKVEKLLTAHGEVLHSLRKQTKRVRYLMNLFTDFYGPTYDAYLQDMKDIQECLGDIQDSMVLEAVLVDILGDDIKKNLPKLANHLTRSRYEAWCRWAQFQRRYLDLVIRKGFHSALLHPEVESS